MIVSDLKHVVYDVVKLYVEIPFDGQVELYRGPMRNVPDLFLNKEVVSIGVMVRDIHLHVGIKY